MVQATAVGSVGASVGSAEALADLAAAAAAAGVLEEVSDIALSSQLSVEYPFSLTVDRFLARSPYGQDPKRPEGNIPGDH